jgi:phosphate transport system substrate-binding protein
LLLAALGLVLSGCSGGGGDSAERGQGEPQGVVRIDGSSTVYPITEAVAEEFNASHPRVRVTIGVSGTGGGFKKFIAGETDISNASRPVKGSELERMKEAETSFVELPVAFDGISVVVSPENDWVDFLTTDELRMIWQPESQVKSWQDVRPEWPDRELKLYGPGTDSGTFDYFTEAINGKSQLCRSDFTASEDDNVLVQGIAGDPDALGFFGFAYYAENKEKLKIVPIDGGNGPVVPSAESINTGTYTPLSRPLFIYVASGSMGNAAVKEFVHFYLDNAAALAGEVGYVGLPNEVYRLARERFDQKKTGTVFADLETTVGLRLEDLLALE